MRPEAIVNCPGIAEYHRHCVTILTNDVNANKKELPKRDLLEVAFLGPGPELIENSAWNVEFRILDSGAMYITKPL